jgi:hypothetical protein
MGNSPGDETGRSLKSAAPYYARDRLPFLQRDPQRFVSVIFCVVGHILRVRRAVRQTRQRANQVCASLEDDHAGQAVRARCQSRVNHALASKATARALLARLPATREPVHRHLVHRGRSAA